MAGWKKYFKVADLSGQMSPISGGRDAGLPGYTRNDGRGSNLAQTDFAFRNYASRLPEVYSGHPNRIERYNQYENMDADSEVNACLDIIAEFSTQLNDDNNTPFEIQYSDEPTDHEIEIIRKQMQQWTKLNKLDQRIFKLFRNTIKYGDQVFVRDPETFEMYWVDMSKVSRVIVNESEGKRPEQYIIRDINPNFQNLTVAAKTTTDFMVNPPTGGGYQQGSGYTMPNTAMTGTSRFSRAVNETCIDAKHVVHLSMNEGLDTFWPFGKSILENIFKVFKQKELLEDALLIYRVQRAPERRVFKIDVGNMPSHLAMQFVERVKNEMHQRRIPTYGGGGGNIMDSSYNPLSINEDFFFPTGADGRGSSVDVLPGGQNLGEIDDLKYFNNKMARGLRVPSSYLPTAPDDSERTMQDGKVGTALIQEYRFNQYCERLQALIMQKLDDEFKMFLRWRGFNIDAGLFQLKFNPPQNFASYRQAEMDTARISSFTSLEQLPYMSKRFMLERFLGLSKDEIEKNEKMWREERDKPELQTTQGQDLRSIGITPAGMETDIATGEEMANLQAPGAEGGLPGQPAGGVGGTLPGAGAPAASPAGL
jgi:Bacteriophage T4-like portal protein (Gp20)